MYILLTVAVAVLWIIALQVGGTREALVVGHGCDEYKRIVRATVAPWSRRRAPTDPDDCGRMSARVTLRTTSVLLMLIAERGCPHPQAPNGGAGPAGLPPN